MGSRAQRLLSIAAIQNAYGVRMGVGDGKNLAMANDEGEPAARVPLDCNGKPLGYLPQPQLGRCSFNSEPHFWSDWCRNWCVMEDAAQAAYSKLCARGHRTHKDSLGCSICALETELSERQDRRAKDLEAGRTGDEPDREGDDP